MLPASLIHIMEMSAVVKCYRLVVHNVNVNNDIPQECSSVWDNSWPAKYSRYDVTPKD